MFSENKEDLQLQLDTFYDYCNAWKLKVNIQKTKAMTFSTGCTNENVHFTFNGEVIENVKTFNYLGIIFSKGGSFVHTMKNNVNKAMVAMYDILKKGRLFNLSVKFQYDLFEKMKKCYTSLQNRAVDQLHRACTFIKTENIAVHEIWRIICSHILLHAQ